MIRFLFISVSFLTIATVSAQFKIATIVDQQTNEPIGLVDVYYKNLSLGTISNDDGKFQLAFEKDTITFSHINYITKEMLFSELQQIDSIYLEPNLFQLDEVVVYNYDLKSKIENLLINYNKYYLGSHTYDVTYKEVVRTNDVITRLAQIQLAFSSKSYKFNFNDLIKNQVEFNIINIDYAKLPSIDSSILAGSFVDNYGSIPVHLNFYLYYILKFTKEINIERITKSSNITTVQFSAPVYENDEVELKLNNSQLVFDNNTGAIIYLKFQADYLTDFSKEFSKRKNINYESKTNYHTQELRFSRQNNNKFQLSSFVFAISSDFKYNGKIENFLSTNNI
jgi:hypothetical protein